MTPTNPEQPDGTDVLKTSVESAEASQVQSPNHSATTPDAPAFGWSAYAERVNGRFAMIGFLAVLAIEVFSQRTFLQWAGILN